MKDTGVEKTTGYRLGNDVVQWVREKASADRRSASSWLEIALRKMMREEAGETEA